MENRVKTKKFIKTLIKKVSRDDGVAFAHQLTFSLMLSFFPFLIFLFTLMGFTRLEPSDILSAMAAYLPQNVYGLIERIVADILGEQRAGLLPASVFMSLYIASGGFMAFMKGANRAMGIRDHRHVLVRRLLSVFWVVLLAGAVMTALAGIVFGRRIVRLALVFLPGLPLGWSLELLKIGTMVACILILFTLFYMLVPAKNVRFRHAAPGAAFAAAAWIAITLLFRVYADHFVDYSRLYGALGAVVALMLWLLLTSVIMLVGVEINALLIRLRGVKDPYIRPVGERRKARGKRASATQGGPP